LRRRIEGPIGFWVELFAVFNLTFLALDVLIAHASNRFARGLEWLPVGFSLLAPALLLPGLFHAGYYARSRKLALVIGALAIGVGCLGMVLHLESAFFARQTLHDLVYTAPFVAPLAYAGIGFLLLLNRMEEVGSLVWCQWVLLLTLGGFVGNLALTLFDHAQNGFFHPSEWLGVAAAAWAVSSLWMMVLRPHDARLRGFCAWLLLGQLLIGGLGFALHLAADVRLAATSNVRDSVLYGAPLFAPLLFPNLALLGWIGLWGLKRAPQPA